MILLRVLAAASVIAVFAGCATEPEADAVPEIPVGVEEGLRAPAIAGVLPGGEEFELPSPIDHSTVLVFYRSAECGLCRLQLTQIQANLEGYDGQDFQVVAITLDSPARSQALVESSGLGYPIVSVDSATFRDWGALNGANAPVPATYVIDDDGIIRFRHIGRNAADRATDADVMTIVYRLASE